MLFCCLHPSSGKYDPVDVTTRIQKQQQQQDKPFPGTRRESEPRPTHDQIKKLNLVQTGGNALMRYDPETMTDLIKVVVPPDCQPGQMLRVTAPDDSSRIVNVIIPQHCYKPGTSFLVQLPPPQSTNNTAIGSNDNQRKNMQTMLIDHDLALKEGVVVQEEKEHGLIGDHFVSLKEKLLGDEEVRDSRDVRDDPRDEDVINAPKNDEEKILLVSVPPNLDPGTTMYVRLPEYGNRYLPVKVPKGNVSQFYVVYLHDHTISESKKIEQMSQNQQNWYDNPTAYGAPMVTMPFLS